MNTRTVLTSALACAVALGLTDPSAAQVKAKEKCFGIAKPGQNDCANLSGSHSCAGQSRVDKGVDEWRYVQLQGDERHQRAGSQGVDGRQVSLHAAMPARHGLPDARVGIGLHMM